MVYAIIAIVVAIALFLIFRNDHDGSYNKNERRGHGAEKSRYEKRTPKAEFKSQPKSQPRTEFKSEPKASNEGHREDVNSGPAAPRRRNKCSLSRTIRTGADEG